MTEVITLLRRPPLDGTFISEMLRMALGLTLSGNGVKVVLAGEAVYLLQTPAPEKIGLAEIDRHVRTLQELGCPFLAEKESAEKRGIADSLFPVTWLTRCTIGEILARSDLVIGC